MTIPTISFPPLNLKSDFVFVEVAFELSFPLLVVEFEAETDPELQCLTNLFLFGAGAGARGSGAAESPGNFLPNFILGIK
jgi:hypothetical protein